MPNLTGSSDDDPVAAYSNHYSIQGESSETSDDDENMDDDDDLNDIAPPSPQKSRKMAEPPPQDSVAKTRTPHHFVPDEKLRMVENDNGWVIRTATMCDPEDSSVDKEIIYVSLKDAFSDGLATDFRRWLDKDPKSKETKRIMKWKGSPNNAMAPIDIVIKTLDEMQDSFPRLPKQPSAEDRAKYQNHK